MSATSTICTVLLNCAPLHKVVDVVALYDRNGRLVNRSDIDNNRDKVNGDSHHETEGLREECVPVDQGGGNWESIIDWQEVDVQVSDLATKDRNSHLYFGEVRGVVSVNGVSQDPSACSPRITRAASHVSSTSSCCLSPCSSSLEYVLSIETSCRTDPRVDGWPALLTCIEDGKGAKEGEGEEEVGGGGEGQSEPPYSEVSSSMSRGGYCLSLASERNLLLVPEYMQFLELYRNRGFHRLLQITCINPNNPALTEFMLLGASAAAVVTTTTTTTTTTINASIDDVENDYEQQNSEYITCILQPRWIPTSRTGRFPKLVRARAYTISNADSASRLGTSIRGYLVPHNHTQFTPACGYARGNDNNNFEPAVLDDPSSCSWDLPVMSFTMFWRALAYALDETCSFADLALAYTASPSTSPPPPSQAPSPNDVFGAAPATPTPTQNHRLLLELEWSESPHVQRMVVSAHPTTSMYWTDISKRHSRTVVTAREMSEAPLDVSQESLPRAFPGMIVWRDSPAYGGLYCL